MLMLFIMSYGFAVRLRSINMFICQNLPNRPITCIWQLINKTKIILTQITE